MIKPRSAWIYAVLAAVFVAFSSLAYVLPAQSILSSVAGNVGVVALVGALFQLFRDQAAHAKALALTRDDQQFQVGAMSHMSAVVFDKHVVFCEEYMAEVTRAIETMIREHANIDAVTHANTLYTIRVRHATWVTAAMSARLSGFEDAMRRMGSKAHYINATAGDPHYDEQRAAAIDFVFSEFERIMPHLFSKRGEEGVSVESIQQRVRTMLGIEELVELRTKLVERAYTALKN